MNKNKKVIIIGSIILVILFWFVFFDTGTTKIIGKAVNSALPSVDNTEIATNNIEDGYKMTKEERIYSYINEIFDMFNNKEYEKLYSLLTDDFKREQFPTYGGFEQFVTNYMNDNEYEPKFKKFYYKDNLFIVLTEFLKSSYTKEDLLNGVPKRFETFVISELAENDYRFAFKDFISSRDLESEAKTSGPITIELVKLNKYKDTRELFFKMTNASDKKVSFSTTKIYVDANLATPKVYYKSFDLEAKGTDTFSIKYFMDYDSPASETEVVLYNLKIDGKTIGMKLPIKYEK